jgi:hypothetical protein
MFNTKKLIHLAAFASILVRQVQGATDQVIAPQTITTLNPAYPLIFGPHTYATTATSYETSVEALAYF